MSNNDLTEMDTAHAQPPSNPEEDLTNVMVLLGGLSTEEREDVRGAFCVHISLADRVKAIQLFLSNDQIRLIKWSLETTLAVQPQSNGTKKLEEILNVW